MDFPRTLSVLIWSFLVYCTRLSDSACSFPTDWDGTWYDGSFPLNDVVLDQASATVTSGWLITVFSSAVSTWTCQSQDKSNNLMLFKGNQFVDLFGADQNAFRCIKWTKLTDYSYVYYIYADRERNAQYTGTSINARVLIEAYDAAVTSWATSSYCNPSNGLPGTEEYVVMVRQGYEAQVSQTCCTPFLITAAYTHNDGISTTCGTGSVWDVCSDRTQMAVNLTQCTIKQFYSAGGKGVCVYFTSSGSTYYQTVLNTDTKVDYRSTYRLTCYAVATSGSNIVASDSLGSCEAGQSPTAKASDGTGTLTLTPYETCRSYSACSFPTEWNGTWYDGSFPTNDIVLDQATATVTSGWSVTVGRSNVTKWTCHSEDTRNNLMLFKGKQTVQIFNSKMNVYRCIKWIKLTDNSYIYYIYGKKDNNAVYSGTLLKARVLIKYDPVVTSSHCNPSEGLPSTEEYVVMVRKGYETQVGKPCSPPFLVIAAYTHNNGSITTCGTGSVWDVCSERTQIAVNILKCSTEQFYSAGGNGVCVYYTYCGSTYYQTVLNIDSSVDYSTTYRLTCYAVATSGSNIVASDSLGSCEAGQSPTAKAIDGTGTLTFTPYRTCGTDQDKGPDTASVEIRGNIMFGIGLALCLLAIVLFTIMLILHKQKLRRKSPINEAVYETSMATNTHSRSEESDYTDIGVQEDYITPT